MIDVNTPDRDFAHGHPQLEPRYTQLVGLLRGVGLTVVVNEIYRPEARQQWLWGQGRLPADCEAKGINPAYARPGPIVTNAWSASRSAHGYTLGGRPAAVAMDVVPVGADGRPWTADDPWDALVGEMARLGPRCGLIQFHAPGKGVWDKPHIQFAEWSDSTHTLEF